MTARARARLYLTGHRGQGRGEGTASSPASPAPGRAIGCIGATSRTLLRMRSVSSKMYRMRQCALRPRPARPAPPTPTGCFLAFHLETPAERGLPPPGPRPPPSTSAARPPAVERCPAGPALGALPAGHRSTGSGCAAGLLGCRGRRGGSGETGRPGSRGVGSPPPALAWGAFRQPDFGVSGRFLRPISSNASKQLLS